MGKMATERTKKVAIFAPIALWERHWAFAIEIAHQEIRKGNQPLIVHCIKALESCPPNEDHLMWKCNQCVHQVKKSISHHFPKSAKHLFIREADVIQTKEKIVTPPIRNSTEMSMFRYDGFPFGSHVISQLVSMNRDRNLTDPVIRETGLKLLINSIAFYEFANTLLPPDIERVILWGGRRSSEAPIKFVAEKRGLKLEFFEESSTRDRYMLTDEYPFVFNNFINLVRKWEIERISKGEMDIMLEEGRKYFLERRIGQSQEPSFIWFNKDAKQIPIIENQGKRILALFTSSDWEFAELEFSQVSDTKTDFINQYTSLSMILQDSFIRENFEIIIRWHPNHRIAGKFEKEQINSVIDSSPHVKHFRYTDSIDSYQLVEKSDIVLVFGSTIGIEASYLEKPTILLGDTHYAGLGSVYQPENMEKLRDLLTRDLSPLPNYGALLFGDYMRNRGKSIRTLSRIGDSYFIHGKRIKNISLIVRIRFYLGNLKRISKAILNEFMLK